MFSYLTRLALSPIIGARIPQREATVREDDVFEQSDLPDLEVLLWKVVHQTLQGYQVSYDDNEMEMIQQVCRAVCPVCNGEGETMMQRDGQPIECRTCKGRGK